MPFGNGLVVAVTGDPARAAAKVRAALGPTPVIRRIAGSGGPLGMPSGPLLPSVTPTVIRRTRTRTARPRRPAPPAP